MNLCTGGIDRFYDRKERNRRNLDQKFSNRFNIHRTRQNFPGDGIDTFENMAQMGLLVTDRVVKEEMGGSLDSKKNLGDTT